MKHDTKPVAFDSFATALLKTDLPGRSDRRFVRNLFDAVEKCKYFQNESQEKVRQLAMSTLNPDVKRCGVLLKMLKRVQADCEKLRSSCTQSGFGFFDQFSAIEGQLREIKNLIALRQGLEVAGMHPSLRKKVKTDFVCELVTPAHDYPFPKLGWKPAETWLLHELDALIAQQIKSISPQQKLLLIQAVFREAGLGGDTKTLKAYEVAVRRHKSAQKLRR